MKTLRQIRETTRRQRVLPLVESEDTNDADCRLLQLHASDKEKWQAIVQFARRIVTIKKYDVFLFAVW
jgi:hypothetical protein